MTTHAFTGRLEDRRLLTGAGSYTSDCSLPGQLHAAFLRSDRPHADIVSIDSSAALAMAGVHAVLTGEDIKAAGIGSLPTQLALNGRDGKPLIKPHRPALAQGKVRFVGEPVACVIADTAYLAQDAVEALMVEYRDLPAITSPREALQSGAPQLHDNVPGNRVIDLGVGDEAKTNEVFSAAKKIVRLRLYNNRVVGSPIEPRAILAHYEAAKDHYTVHSCTQGVNNLRAQLGATMGIADDKIDVVAKDVGGGFGLRGNVYPEYCAVVLAAKKLNRPVKWTSSRSEAFLADEHARDVYTEGEVALDANGRILALRFSFVTNLGAYCAPAGPFINSRSLACFTGVYDVPIAFARNQMMLTNTAPLAAYRGAGRPIMSAILERLMTRAALELGMDSAELRRRNMIAKDKFPYTLANGNVYDSGDPLAVMDDALAAAKWQDTAAFEQRRAEAKARGRLRGRGLACTIESTGAGNAPHDEVQVRFDADGKITMYAVSHSSGQGHETTYAQIISRITGLPYESFQLKEGDPQVRLVGNGTGGSRSTHGAGSAMMVAANDVIKKGMGLAGKELEVSEVDLEFKDGAYRIKGTDRAVTLESLAKKYAGARPHPLDVRSINTSGVTYPNGCHIAEVEIDPVTGNVEILSYIACDDAGNIISHELVEGQMMGSLTQGAGQVLGELAYYDPQTGQLLTGSFMDYTMPRAILVDGLQLLDHPVPTPTNPLGAKGVGESGVTGSLPTLMNAITDALAHAGVTEFDMPATPLRVWQAIEAAKAGKPAAMALEQG
ncbi:MAG: xanthine dehydrogenase family protein molybdopterin-binding subunit [Betaproteobacteria bacterium]|nr:xanthine dehydrogenase family protein molybdopterin-binding subunit [Betaproteobacteria bacterium]